MLCYDVDWGQLSQLFSLSSLQLLSNSDVRRAMMIKHHEPGPYIDVVGPTVLTTILVLTITVQFFGKLRSVMKEEPINYN